MTAQKLTSTRNVCKALLEGHVLVDMHGNTIMMNKEGDIDCSNKHLIPLLIADKWAFKLPSKELDRGDIRTAFHKAHEVVGRRQTIYTHDQVLEEMYNILEI